MNIIQLSSLSTVALVFSICLSSCANRPGLMGRDADGRLIIEEANPSSNFQPPATHPLGSSSGTVAWGSAERAISSNEKNRREAEEAEREAERRKNW